jgi:uncharacterized membrane protein YgcG
METESATEIQLQAERARADTLAAQLAEAQAALQSAVQAAESAQAQAATNPNALLAVLAQAQRTAMEQVAQASTAMATSVTTALQTVTGANSSPKPVRAVDIDLDKFSGGSSSSTVVTADQLLPFDRWFRISMHRMSMYKLADGLRAACLISHLDGPAQKAWFARYENAHDITPDEFYNRFCELIPHYKLFCTESYTTMSFKPATLVQDVEDFLSYVRFSGIMQSLDLHHEVLCDMFFKKLSHSCAHLVEMARNCYGIELKSSDPLSILARNTQSAARRYLQDYPSGRPTGGAASAGMMQQQQQQRPTPSPSASKKKGANGGNGHTANGNGSGSGGGSGNGNGKGANASRKRTLDDLTPAQRELATQTPTPQLLTEHNRCPKCAYWPSEKDHKCKADRLEERVLGIRRCVGLGQDPNKFPRPAKRQK